MQCFRSFVLLAFVLGRVSAQENPATVAFSAKQQATLSALATHILSDVMLAGCTADKCAVFVDNLVLPSGKTCTACLAITDALTAKLSEGSSSAHIINSEELRNLVVEGRIPLETNLSAQEAWWLGTKLKATHIVFGIVEPQQGALKLKLSLFKPEEVKNDKLIGSKFEVSVPVEQLGNLLEPSEPFAGIVPLYRDASGHPIARPGKNDANTPSCSHMSNPPYSEAAREHKISGIILVIGTITKEGKLEDPLVIRGLPYGLNENALNVMKTWRCKPSQLDGKPFPTRVQFEINFKLY